MALCLAAETATLGVIFGSPGQDTGDIRWSLVVLPLLAAAAPLALPYQGVRIGAALVMGAWCVLAVASVGLFFVPSLLALIVALIVSERGPGARA